MTQEPAADGVPPLALKLVGQQELLVETKPDSSLLRIVDSSGKVSLSVLITAEGPVLRFEGRQLWIQTEGDLGLDAERLVLHARKHLVLSSGGNAKLAATGDMQLEARVQDISATQGNVNVKANDDVCLHGERVKVNC